MHLLLVGEHALTRELLDGVGLRRRRGRVVGVPTEAACLKVDLRKAYDSVNRQFLYNQKNQSSLPATYRFHLNLQTRLFIKNLD